MRYRIGVMIARYVDLEVEARSEREALRLAIEGSKDVPAERWSEYRRFRCCDDDPPPIPIKILRASEEPEPPEEGEARRWATRVSKHSWFKLTVDAPTKREALRRVTALELDAEWLGNVSAYSLEEPPDVPDWEGDWTPGRDLE